MSTSKDCPYLMRSGQIAAAETTHSHPWNPVSLMHGVHLSQMAGLSRCGISLVRIPPGKESFVYHMHHFEEEWIFILSGNGTADIDDQEYAVGQGDFMAFPANSVAHHLRNTSDAELVYLMGGENRDYEVADFPRLGKRMLKLHGEVLIYELGSGRSLGPLQEGADD